MTKRIRPITDKERLFIGQKKMLLRHFEIYPTGILSEVMDTWDLWQVLTELLPDPEIKAAVLKRDGKLVIRPDSGDPVDIICGTYWQEAKGTKVTPTLSDKNQAKGVIELLWDVFGGTVNEQGYKVLDPHIGAIYGDSITLDRAEQICERLKAKGFASTNIVLGIGSYTYQYNTRDTFGFAVKATYGEVTHHDKDLALASNGTEYKDIVEEREIFKDPITDDGTKKSAKGLLMVQEVLTPDSLGKLHHTTYKLKDQCTKEEEQSGALETVFENGNLVKEVALDEIRKRLTL